MLFNLNVSADSFVYVWEEGTTYVDVPLNANINDYTFVPKASLYRNGIELTDAVIHANPNGDWLYLLTDVDTSKVGDYKVWYKLTEEKYKPGHCQGYKTLVTFHVVDDLPPIITKIPISLTYKIGYEKINYLEQVSAYDNSGVCDITIIDDQVNYNKVGSYSVTVKAFDGYQATYGEFLVVVRDEEGPRISFLGDNNTVVMNVGEEINLIEYFSAYDDVDGDVTSTIKYNTIDVSVEKTFPVVVSFNDHQGNYSEMEIMVQVIDVGEPEIILKEESLLLDYKTDFSKYDFYENINSAYDGKVDIRNDVGIDISSLENKVGVYSIYYYYNDNSGVYKVECKIHLLSNESPVVDTQDVEVEKGETIDYSDYINVSDPSDSTVSSSMQIDDSRVDFHTPGVYPVYITATNSSGLMTTDILYVTVVEEEKEELDWKIILIAIMAIYFIGGKLLDKKK